MWQKFRRFGIEIYAFFTAPFVIKNCLSMLGLFAGLVLLTLWWLQCFTNHGESVQVPSYVGLSFRDAAKKARSRDFGLAVSDSVYIPGKPSGEITAQNPKAESRVKEGRTIYVTVTKSNPDIVKLPGPAYGEDYDLYSRKLSRMGLKPRIIARVADPKSGANTIISVVYRGDTITQKIRNGISVEVGGVVDFIVSEAVTLSVNIPDCLCQTFDAAKFIVQTSGLSIGTVIKDATVSDPENAYVWRQSPAYDPNGILRKGQQIDIYLTQEKPRTCQ